MKTENIRRGFTLMEVLVVVLIVGILVAFAVPQYQKSVLKSRFAGLLPLAKALSNAEEAYYMEHGSYTGDKTKLDVSTPQTGVTLGNEENHKYVKLTRSDIKNNLTMYQKHSPNFAGEIHCEALQDNELANWLCQESLKGTFVGKKFGYNIYALDVTDPNSTLGRVYYNTKNLTIEDGDSCEAYAFSGYYPCQGTKATDGGFCKGNSGSYACYGARLSDESKCIANVTRACQGITVSSYSSCESNASQGCYGTYSDHSWCTTATGRENGAFGCNSSSYTKYSYCEGNGGTGSWPACARSSFTDHSVCYANAGSSCTSNKYDTTSFCASEKGFCPRGTPKGTWNAGTESYELNGWNGDCCNPSYMTDGVCPTGATVCS